MTEFQCRGAIVRIRIRNFMTYTDTEFRPGPNLNMILGPNGTGKSAIVCCIIVGLAGEVNLTGRGANAADFVKKDTDWASTEIELYNNRGKNDIIERKITITNRTQFKNDHKSDWKINGRTCLKSEVQKTTAKLNIKVDNLCQFLPQDSVTQFVKMNPCELLLNTLKAAGDSKLVEDHQKLIQYTNDATTKRVALESLKNSCKENEVNARRLESEVSQLRQRETLMNQKKVCSEKIHYVRYTNAKSNLEKALEERRKLKDQLQTILDNNEPRRQAVEHHRSMESKLRESFGKLNAEVRSTKEKMRQGQNNIEQLQISCQKEFAKFKGKQETEDERQSSIQLKEQELLSLECRLNESRDIDCSEQINQVETEVQGYRDQLILTGREKGKLDDQLQNLMIQIEELVRQRTQIEQVKDKKINACRSRFPEAGKVMDWLSKNQHQFKEKIYYPIMCEINVKEPKFNRIVEHAIPRSELSAFVCQNSADLQKLTQIVRNELKTRFNVILVPDKTINQFNMDASQNRDLSHLGIKAYLKDLIDAPEPIMRYLCGSHYFHKVPVADNCSEAQLKDLLACCPRFYVGSQYYQCSKSRYDGKTMTVSDQTREAQLLQYSLDTLKLAQCSRNLREVEQTKAAVTKERDAEIEKDGKIRREWSVKLGVLQELKNKQEGKARLESLIERTREGISRLRREKIDLENERKKLHTAIDKINRQMVNCLEELAGIYTNFTNLSETQMITKLQSRVARRNTSRSLKKYEAAKKDTTRITEAIASKRRVVVACQKALEESQSLAEERIRGFSDGKLRRSVKEAFDAVEQSTIEELTALREELNVRIQRIHNDPSNTILAEFERQNDELKEKRLQIATLEGSISEINAARGHIKRSWLPKLEEVIDVVDKNYREFMRGLSYDGRVKLDYKSDQPENFASYGILILVKYRDNEQLIPLSSTRQSGGERSVATMIYMLALQAKTTAPFRCVDEINQGMDKENERKVFELLVHTADSSSSQYFLVSPKLLSNLPYSSKMKIHVVFNGSRLGVSWNDV